MNQKFDDIVSRYLRESPQPVEAPPKPQAPPAPTTTPTPNEPKPGNPDPFRRHEPGQMPDVRPKSKSAAAFKQNLISIIKKHTRFLRGQ